MAERDRPAWLRGRGGLGRGPAAADVYCRDIETQRGTVDVEPPDLSRGHIDDETAVFEMAVRQSHRVIEPLLSYFDAVAHEMVTHPLFVALLAPYATRCSSTRP